jgi:hypothetical protein
MDELYTYIEAKKQDLRLDLSLCDYNSETTPANNLECKAVEKKACHRITIR